MSDFDAAIGTILQHEGGYTVDHAGATNFGITLPVLQAAGRLAGDLDLDGDVDADDIRLLTEELAIEIYSKQWWGRYGYDRIDYQALATKVFDMSVNMGPGRAHRLLQEAVNVVVVNDVLQVDGVLGPLTLAAVNRCEPQVLHTLRKLAATFYYQLASRNEEKYGRYVRGWLRRAYA